MNNVKARKVIDIELSAHNAWLLEQILNDFIDAKEKEDGFTKLAESLMTNINLELR